MSTYPGQFEKTNIYHYPTDIQDVVASSSQWQHDALLACMVRSMSVAFDAMVKARSSE